MRLLSAEGSRHVLRINGNRTLYENVFGVAALFVSVEGIIGGCQKLGSLGPSEAWLIRVLTGADTELSPSPGSFGFRYALLLFLVLFDLFGPLFFIARINDNMLPETCRPDRPPILELP